MKAMRKQFDKHTGLLAIAGALLLLVAFVGIALERKETVDDWFTVNALSIPDHLLNTDPIIVFDRTISRNLSGLWTVETQTQTGPRWITICRGAGLSHYSPDESLPASGVSLGWFRDQCTPAVGVHRLQVVWRFTDPDTGDTKTRIFETEPYTVYK